MSHTPGPWSVGFTQERKYATGTYHEVPVNVGAFENRGNCLAMVVMGGPGAIRRDSESVEANARLIAAAPELLEALKHMAQHHSPECSRYDVVVAEGECNCGYDKAQLAIAKATGGAEW